MSRRSNHNQRFQHPQSHTNSQSASTSSPSRSNIKMNTSSRYPYTSSPISTTLPHPFTVSMPISSHPNIQFKDQTSHSLFHDEPSTDTFTLDPTNKSLQALTSLLHLRTSSPSLESIIPSSAASTSSQSSTSESSPISSPVTRHQHRSPSRSRSRSCTRSRSSSPHSDVDETRGIIAHVIPPPPDSTTTKRHAIKKYGTVVNAMQLDVSQVSALQRKVASLRKKRKHAPGSGNYQRKRQIDQDDDVLEAEPVKQVESPIKRQRVLSSTSSVSKSSSSSSLSSLSHSLPPAPTPTPTPTPIDDIHPFRQLISRLKRRHLLAYHRLAADAAQQHLKSMTSDDTHITITPTTPSSHPHMGISPTPILTMGSTSPIPLLGSHGSAFAGMKSHVISPTPVSTPSPPGFSSFPPSTLPPFSYPTSSTSRPFPIPFSGKRTSGSSTSGLSPFSLSSFNMSPLPVAVM